MYSISVMLPLTKKNEKAFEALALYGPHSLLVCVTTGLNLC
jgi:hypothetical protein